MAFNRDINVVFPGGVPSSVKSNSFWMAWNTVWRDFGNKHFTSFHQFYEEARKIYPAEYLRNPSFIRSEFQSWLEDTSVAVGATKRVSTKLTDSVLSDTQAKRLYGLAGDKTVTYLDLGKDYVRRAGLSPSKPPPYRPSVKSLSFPLRSQPAHRHLPNVVHYAVVPKTGALSTPKGSVPAGGGKFVKAAIGRIPSALESVPFGAHLNYARKSLGKHLVTAIFALDVLSAKNKTPPLFGMAGMLGAGAVLRKAPWWGQLLGRIAGYTTGRFLGTALTRPPESQIEALEDSAIVSALREKYTQFGSGWKGLQRFITPIEKKVTPARYWAPKFRRWVFEEEALAVEKNLVRQHTSVRLAQIPHGSRVVRDVRQAVAPDFGSFWKGLVSRITKFFRGGRESPFGAAFSSILRVGGVPEKKILTGRVGLEEAYSATKRFFESEGVEIVRSPESFAAKINLLRPGYAQETTSKMISGGPQMWVPAGEGPVFFRPSWWVQSPRHYIGMLPREKKIVASFHEAVELSHIMRGSEAEHVSKFMSHQTFGVLAEEVGFLGLFSRKSAKSFFRRRAQQYRGAISDAFRLLEKPAALPEEKLSATRLIAGSYEMVGIYKGLLREHTGLLRRRSLLKDVGSIERTILAKASKHRKVLERFVNDEIGTTTRGTLHAYHEGAIRGITNRGFSGLLNRALGYGSGIDPARKFIGLLGKTVREVVGHRHFQRAIKEGTFIRRIGHGGTGTIDLFEAEVRLGVEGRIKAALRGDIKGAFSKHKFQYVRKTYTDTIQHAAAIREAEVMGLEALGTPAAGQIAPTVYGIGKTGTKKAPTLFMEYIDKAQTLDRHSRFGKKLSSDEFQRVKSAVNFMHKHGLAHTDITVKNILVDAKGRAFLIDPVPFRHAGISTDVLAESALHKVRILQDQMALRRMGKWVESSAGGNVKELERHLWEVSNAPSFGMMARREARAIKGVTQSRYRVLRRMARRMFGEAKVEIPGVSTPPVGGGSRAATVASRNKPVTIDAQVGESFVTGVDVLAAGARKKLSGVVKRQQLHNMAVGDTVSNNINPGRRHRSMSQSQFITGEEADAFTQTLIDPLGDRRPLWERFVRAGR